MKRDGVTESPAGRWTRSEDYLGAMARKRTFRRHRRRDRTQPEVPQMLLSTVPFLALLLLLGVLAVGIMVAAFPGSQPPEKAPQLAHKEQGFAPRGWLQEAQKEFHR
jgi:hypothetical protein